MGTQSVEKTLAMPRHLIALTGFIIPFGHILGPVIVWMIGKSDSLRPVPHGLGPAPLYRRSRAR
ncbi:MAG: hypothetical protein DMF77_17845 [Acidobacteria bacterium]|nr:MAG: hypothetical protein DMF77_17845 [Acidobacteriota bacterium]